VKDACAESADAARQEHVAELRDRRIRKHLLDVPLRQPIVAANSAVAAR